MPRGRRRDGPRKKKKHGGYRGARGIGSAEGGVGMEELGEDEGERK